MNEFEDLVRRFHKLAEITGTDKSSSYEVKLTYTLRHGLFLDLGCYEIGDWPRHLAVNQDGFNTVDELCLAFKDLIEKAEIIVNNPDTVCQLCAATLVDEVCPNEENHHSNNRTNHES